MDKQSAIVRQRKGTDDFRSGFKLSNGGGVGGAGDVELGSSLVGVTSVGGIMTSDETP